MKRKSDRKPETKPATRPVRPLAPKQLEAVQGGVKGGVTASDDWEAPLAS